METPTCRGVTASAVTHENGVCADHCTHGLFLAHRSLKTLLAHRLVRFLFFGGSAAAVNVALMYGFIDWLGWNTVVLRNLANVISVELSLLYSYVVYRLFVWNEPGARFQEPLPKQLLRYHGSAGAAILIRWVLLFPLLDFLGVHHLINTIIGALGSCVINYLLASRYVFHMEKVVSSQ